MDLDIIIPVYNEGDKIIKVLDALKNNVTVKYRVLICYDNDNDNTLTSLKNHKSDTEIMPVKNKGLGAHGAILTGFKFSTAPCCIVLPADDDYNADIIDKMYYEFKNGADIVAASRFMPGGCMKGAPPLKAFLVRLSAFVLFNLAGLPVHDPSNGFRLFSKKVLDTISIESSKGFVYSIELLVKAHRLKLKISEVPAKWFERTSGKSRFQLFKWLPSYLRWFFYAFSTTWLRFKKV